MEVPLVSPKASLRPPGAMRAVSPAVKRAGASQRSPDRVASTWRVPCGPVMVTAAEVTSAPVAHGRKLHVRHNTVPPSSRT